MLGAFLGMALANGAQAQSADEKLIRSAIKAFSEAGDRNNVPALETVLDSHYRVVMNRLFGSTSVSVMPREVYLEKSEARNMVETSAKSP